MLFRPRPNIRICAVSVAASRESNLKYLYMRKCRRRESLFANKEQGLLKSTFLNLFFITEDDTDNSSTINLFTTHLRWVHMVFFFTVDIRRCQKMKSKSSPDQKQGRVKKELFSRDVNSAAFLRLRAPGTETNVPFSNRLVYTKDCYKAKVAFDSGAGQSRRERNNPPKPGHLLAKNMKHQDWRLMDGWSPNTFFYNFISLSSVGSWWDLIR